LRYVTTPKELHYSVLTQKNALSPRIYETVTCANINIKKVVDLVEEPVKGKEVGSQSYVDSSNKYFIRNRALQEIGYLIQNDSESVIPIKPQSFMEYDLAENDILYSKDSNIGECCIIESNDYKKNYMISSGILKLVAKESPLYLFGFLKHSFVKTQLYCMTPPSATIRHSGMRFLSCIIPFPNGANARKVVAYVESLVQNIINAERTIREKDKRIHEMISQELLKNQKSGVTFNYQLPTIKEIEQTQRLDAGIYSRQYKEKMFPIINYANGFEPLTSKKLDFSIKPGPSLEIKILKTRIDSEELQDDFYTLILPTYISDYGVVDKLQYIGTARKIEELKFGDMLLGESGTWRSMVLLSNQSKCITDAHGSRLRQQQGNVVLSIFVRCILAWYKKTGIFDYMVVGGSGGHFSPSYFNKVLIPNFPDKLQREIAELYYDEEKKSGIAQLSEQRFTHLRQLDTTLDNIINDKQIDI
jgi:type I restriction enzyme S subunit